MNLFLHYFQRYFKSRWHFHAQVCIGLYGSVKIILRYLRSNVFAFLFRFAENNLSLYTVNRCLKTLPNICRIALALMKGLYYTYFNLFNHFAGQSRQFNFMNFMILVSKLKIYKSEWNNIPVAVNMIIEEIEYYLEIEEYVSTITIGRRNTLGKWSPIYNIRI